MPEPMADTTAEPISDSTSGGFSLSMWVSGHIIRRLVLVSSDQFHIVKWNVEEEAATNNPRTAADLLRGVREQVADIDPAAEAINTLLHRVMWRYTKAHMQSTREDLSEGQLVGEARLHEDFLAQIGSLESVVCKCTRKARAWGRLSNGGYSSTNAKAFQEG
ncbi:unnamed protein product [Ectocarpus sp. CCAP 1310/34]|nr:unnamed protein product [Ectocarpus sp. CCAP 1310/34]